MKNNNCEWGNYYPRMNYVNVKHLYLGKQFQLREVYVYDNSQTIRVVDGIINKIQDQILKIQTDFIKTCSLTFSAIIVNEN